MLVTNLPPGTHLTPDLGEALVKGKFLPVAANRVGALHDALRASKPNWPNPQVHHELPFTYADWFARHGLDVNQPTFTRANGQTVWLGRWVDGAPTGPHQSWTPDFNAKWSEFQIQERFLPGGRQYTQEEVIQKMLDLRNSGNYPARRRAR